MAQVSPVVTIPGDDFDRRWSLRAATSPHDEQGGRVPAVTFVTNNNNKQGGRGRKPNNNTKKGGYGNQHRKSLNNSNNNNNNNNWKRRVSFSSSAPSSSSSLLSAPTGYLKERITVDYISPGLHGDELYVYTQGKFTSCNKPDDQPLILDPSSVVYKCGNDTSDDDEKEVWEKLCAENKIVVTFNPENWEITEIASVDENKPTAPATTPTKTEEPLEWARGQSPPRRRRASWGNTNNAKNVNARQKTPQRKQSERGRSRQGSPPERGQKGGKKGGARSKNNNNNNQQDGKRRGSLSSVRELRNAMNILAAPDGGDNKEDFAARMARLEQSNMALQQQLEEAQSKIKLLEVQSDKKPSPVL